MSYPALLLLGDSLTEHSTTPSGSGTLLSQAYTRRADILNRGLSGYTSTFLLPFLSSLLSPSCPSPSYSSSPSLLSSSSPSLLSPSSHSFSPLPPVFLILLLLGTNDSVLPGNVHHTPLATFSQNLERILRLIQSSEATRYARVLVITPPPMAMRMLRERGPRKGVDRELAVLERYVRAVREFAGEQEGERGGEKDGRKEGEKEGGEEGGRKEGVKVGLCDFWDAVMKAGEGEVLERFFTDGLHLSGDGYRLLFESIMNSVKELWPEVLPENMPMMAPWWGDLEVVRAFGKEEGDEKGEEKEGVRDEEREEERDEKREGVRVRDEL